MALFDQQFLRQLPTSPLVAVYKMANFIFYEFHEEFRRSPDSDLFEAHAFLCEFVRQSELNISIPCPEPGDFIELGEFCRRIKPAVDQIEARDAKSKQADAVARFMAQRQGIQSVTYEFSAEGYGIVQEHITNLREAVVTSKSLGDEHRFRLLKRIEAVQRELHKDMRSLDQFFMLVYDGSVVVRRLMAEGAEIAKEGARLALYVTGIQRIVSETAARAEGLDGVSLPGIPSTVQLEDIAKKTLEVGGI